MRKYLLLLLLLPLHLFATTYYFSSSGSNSNSGTSAGSAWQTLSKFQTVINNGTVHSNDSVLFKRGDIFSGEVIIQTTRGGSAKNNINISTYGSGAKPIFLYAGSGAQADDRTTLLIIGVNGWHVDNLHLTDTSHTNDKTTPAWCGFPMYLGSIGEASTNNFVIHDVDIDYCGMGFVWFGTGTEIYNCNLSNFKDLVNNGTQNDYGANPYTLLDATDSYVHDNIVTGGWAASNYFGFNGGYAEMFGANKRNRFQNEYIDDCNGISEFGANGATALADSNTYAYIKCLNSGAAFYCNISGPFAMQVANTYFYQSILIEQNGTSRFSGSNLAAGLTGAARTASLASPDSRAFGYNTNPTATFLYICKNNVYQCSTPMDIFQNSTTKTQHTYGYYKLSGGSSANVTLSTGEVSGSASLFTTESGNANTWNLRPIVSGALWGTGQQITGFTTDFSGHPIANNIGVYGPIVPVVTNALITPGFIKNGSVIRPIHTIKTN